jgi:hypothetical protein
MVDGGHFTYFFWLSTLIFLQAAMHQGIAPYDDFT